MATLTKSTGTVTLSGAVEKVAFPAVYGWVWLKNMSDADIFAGLSADISEGADGVMTIPAGECGRLQTDGFDSVYLMGLGNALVVAQNYADCPFKVGGKGGEIPDLSVYALKSKYGDTTINVGRLSGSTVGEYSIAEGMKTTASGQVSKASGYYTEALGDYSYSGGFFARSIGHSSFAYGNRARTSKNNEVAFGIFNISNDDTLFSIGDGKADNGKHNALEITKTGGKLHDEEIMTQNKISNPNLLINPDFKINQRGDNSYTSRSESKYTVDRWKIVGTCVPTSTGVTVYADNSAYNYGSFYQIIENYISNQDVTLSAKANGKIYHFTGNTSESSIGRINITDENGNDAGYVRITNSNVHNTVEFIIFNGFQMEIEWVKLEYGSIATPFVSPEPTTELLKCQRYYQVRSENNIAAVDLRPNMRDGVVPTITALADGNYSYSAEL